MIENTFKAALKRREPQVGLWLSLASPYTAEICATAGFDWLLIDGEHAPNDVRSILAQLQAVAPYPAHPIARAVTGDVALVKQLLDIGAQTLLIPMVDTAEQARQMVAACRYPPQGVRGDGSGIARASRWGLFPDYAERANAEVCLLVQAESRLAVDNLDAICAVEGVDGVFVGPADLAASLGHANNPGHPEVKSVIDNALLRIVASGKAAGILTSDVTAARRYIDMGCTFVAVGLDVRLLANAARELRSMLSGDAPTPAGKKGGAVY